MSAFKAYDIRGIYNKDFDKETVYKIGYFIPKLLKSPVVLVGRDVRTTSDEIFAPSVGRHRQWRRCVGYRPRHNPDGLLLHGPLQG